MAAPARVALVTGGAMRIGGAITRALAGAGYATVIHTHEHAAAAAALAQEIIREGGHAASGSADLSRVEAIAPLMADAAKPFGPVTLLVNCASTFEDDAVGALDVTRWDRQFAVNLRAPIFLAQAFAAQLPANTQGCIVNVTDQRARKLVPRQFSYTLTKSALDAATVMLAQALSPRIRVNAVQPGPTLPSPRQDADAFRHQQTVLPLGAGPSPDDIAAAVVYLAGASMVTGETLAVDGGQHIAWKSPDSFGFDE